MRARVATPRGVCPARPIWILLDSDLGLILSVTQHHQSTLMNLPGARNTMTTLIGFHEVDDVQHWLASTRRDEIFGTVGATVRTFVDPQGGNRVGVIIDAPDVD